MKYASLTAAQLTAIRPALTTLATTRARRATSIGARVPAKAQPPASYRDGAVGWTVPYALYPQRNGTFVLLVEDDAWATLNPARRALFTLPGLPADFGQGAP